MVASPTISKLVAPSLKKELDFCVHQVLQSLAQGNEPKLTEDGTSGTYIIKTND